MVNFIPQFPIVEFLHKNHRLAFLSMVGTSARVGLHLGKLGVALSGCLVHLEGSLVGHAIDLALGIAAYFLYFYSTTVEE